MKKFLAIGVLLTFLMSTAAFAEDVFVTQKGSKYHQELCKLIQKKEVSSLDEKEAIEEGYDPCKRCFKDEIKEGKKDKKAKLTKSTKSKKKKKQEVKNQ